MHDHDAPLQAVGYRQRKSTRGCQWDAMMKTYNAAHPHARLINPKTGIDVTARTA